MDHTRLIEKALKGDRLATGRLLTIVERDPRGASVVLESLPDREGYHVIGITGIAGSGKSTLLSRLLTHYADRGYRCAVVAIDPSSAYSRGALLGDRIRMQMHATNPNIFIRSVSTRGLKGGLSFAGVAMVDVFGRLGYDKVFIESIGVGQADVDIMRIADTIVVVTVPGLGDDIQALKAGVMEIGDVYVINKVDKDREGANKTMEYLLFAIEAGELGHKGWRPRIVKTSAVLDEGIGELIEAIEEHYKYLVETGGYGAGRERRREILVRLLAEKMLIDALDNIEIEPGKDLYQGALELLRRVTAQYIDMSGADRPSR